MPSYDVTIQATVTKTLRIENAASEQDAIEEAHGQFTAGPDGTEEKYDEQCIGCKEVK